MQPFDYQKSVVEIYNLLKSKNMSEKDIKSVLDAYAFANEKHKGSKRESGEPYITHPYRVFKISAQEMPIVDAKILAADFLHDTMEDCQVTFEELEERFGSEVANYVNILTDIHKLNFCSLMEADQYNFHALLTASILYRIAPLLNKFADRLDNLRTLQHKKGEYKRVHTADETLNVYVPLAHYLGMEDISTKMENVAFHYRYPRKEQYIKQKLKKYLNNNYENIESFSVSLIRMFSDNHLVANVTFHLKSIPKIYWSLNQHQTFEQIPDLKQIQIVVETEEECYRVQELIKSYYSRIKHRDRDYIVYPRPNLYQALHMTIDNKDGALFEIRIMTKEMEQINKHGIAYYGTADKIQEVFEQKFEFFRKLLENKLITLSQLPPSSLPISENNETIEIESESGQKVFLPKGSTIYDYIYSYYRDDYAHHIIGAIVNGSEVTCDYCLNDGDRVKVIYSYDAHIIEDKEDIFSKCTTWAAKNGLARRLTRT